MRLLYTIPDFWPHVRRGSERLVHDLGTVMVRHGHDVTVVTRTPDRRPSRIVDSGMKVVYRPGPTEVQGWPALEGFARTASLWALREPADVYHAFYMSDAFGLLRAMRLRRRPFVFSLHGPPSRAFWERAAPRTHRWFLRVLDRAAAVTVLSEDSARRMREDYGRDPRVLVPGVFIDDFVRERRHGGPPTIVCAAAVDDRRKRLDVLVDAFALVAGEDRDLRLLLVGPGTGEDVRRRAAALPGGVAARIEHRPVPTAELPDVYSAATVGALTSEREAFGLVLVEYLAAGIPGVGTDDGGIPEVLTPDTGALFAPGDVEACADALRRALDLAARAGATERCRARARDFDWEARSRDHEALYAEVRPG